MVLDLQPPAEINARPAGDKLRHLKRESVARLFQQAYAPAGVLTNTQMALLLKSAPTTVGKVE